MAKAKRGRPAKLVIGDRMPEDVEILLHPDHLAERLHDCTMDRGGRSTNIFSAPTDEMVELEI